MLVLPILLYIREYASTPYINISGSMLVLPILLYIREYASTPYIIIYQGVC